MCIKTREIRELAEIWCARWDSNPHAEAYAPQALNKLTLNSAQLLVSRICSGNPGIWQVLRFYQKPSSSPRQFPMSFPNHHG